MRILIAHNHYQQAGGEDTVALSEVEMLRKQGHEVLFLEMSNKDFNSLSVKNKAQQLLSWDWSQSSYDFLKNHCHSFKPDIAHFHNTFFMFTPAVYAACKDSAVPVVQTLHNFRLLCANALLFRDGHICDACVGHSLIKAIAYGCYHDSRILSWAVARMIEKNRHNKTWQEKVDCYIALTDFARDKFIEGGLPAERIVVKPNGLAIDPGERQIKGDYFVFAGRLSHEKGIAIALQAFKGLPSEKLQVLGAGPLKSECEMFIKSNNLKNIELRGHLEKREYYEILSKAKALIVPSICYENFPMVILEAFALGIPVIASNLGSMKEIVQDAKVGLLFKPGDVQDLIIKINFLNRNLATMTQWGNTARKEFENKFTSKANYERLLSIYNKVKKH